VLIPPGGLSRSIAVQAALQRVPHPLT